MLVWYVLSCHAKIPHFLRAKQNAVIVCSLSGKPYFALLAGRGDTLIRVTYDEIGALMWLGLAKWAKVEADPDLQVE